MITETKKVVALAAMIVAIGVGGVEMTRDTAQADARIVAGGAAGYAGARIDEAFALAAMLPAAEPVSFAVASKGDRLPVDCTGECMDAAYEVASEEPLVVETQRGASSSILVRLSRITVAGF
jgi:hypothetical protein